MRNLTFLIAILLMAACTTQPAKQSKTYEKAEIETTISKADLKDKIKGGWAGQVIGCTFGGPTEFKFKGGMINDYMPIPWNDSLCLWWYKNAPGLYDDVYMDLTFVDIFEKEGIDAPASSHALAFANAEYQLWHANQAARYNILNGIMPPESGHWLYNPHADDIDFQIEADFAGLMAPGMVNTASEICDKVGHIMNYGDGWYGGVYVAAMYAMAFVTDDVETVVVEALKAIPEASQFYQCINDVINWYYEYPDDWKQNWFETEKKWSADIGCPDGVFKDFNIDAKINAAYIVIGMLYGEGDYSKTMEISTRCGQDSDCNPASAGGILGTILGYSNIPEFWKKPVYPVEDMDFKYTTVSLNDVYEMGTKHALQVLENNGVDTKGESIKIPIEEIKPVALEIGFEGHYPTERTRVGKRLGPNNKSEVLEFEGNGFVLTGGIPEMWSFKFDDVVKLQVQVDELEAEEVLIPAHYGKRRLEVAWKYQLPEGKHSVKVSYAEGNPDFEIELSEIIVYSSNKIENSWKTH